MDSTREQQMHAVQTEALELFSRKNKDYGDAFADYGPIGVIVRMGDKIRRLQNITSNSVAFVKDEGIRDTLIDLHNYAAMAVMLIDEQYNKEGLSPDSIYTPPIPTPPPTPNPIENLDSPVNADFIPPPPPRPLYRQLTEKWDD
tara:strand:- start:3851 stop:4282 length:432 start_codon:yes stop_codon:yes gene_type:complete